MDEDGTLPDLTSIDVAPRTREILDADPRGERYESVARLHYDYANVVRSLGIDRGAKPDNHTHTLEFGGISTTANSLSLECILFDLEVVRLTHKPNIELVANSFGQRWIESATPTLQAAALAHVLVIEQIPNYNFPDGPYHPAVDDARQNPYLKDFRKWISTTSSSSSGKEIAEIKASVEEALRVTQREIFLKYLEGHRQYASVGKTLTGFGADLVFPGVGTAASLVHNVREARSSRDIRWQGFLVALAGQHNRPEDPHSRGRQGANRRSC